MDAQSRHLKVILVVDDDAIGRKLLRVTLEAEGFTALEAGDGLEALDVLNRHEVDAIISDILMPRMDGFRLCHEVKKSERFRHLAFIIYTATYTTPNDEKLALDSGADRYLRKPCPAPVLLAALTEAAMRPKASGHHLQSPPQEKEVMREYSEALVRKLEEKNDELERTTEELRRQHDWLRVTLASIGDAVIAADTSGRIIFLNPLAAALTGWQPAEAEGQQVQNVFRIVIEQTQGPAEDIVSRVLKEGHVVELATHKALITKDGREIPIEYSAAPICNSAGAVIGVVLVFYDVTDERRAQEALRRSEERLSSIIGTAMDAIITLDEEFNVVVFNAAAETIFRCPAAEAIGKPLDRFLPERFRTSHREHVDRFARTGETTRSIMSPATLYGRRADGEEFPFEATISRASSGGQKLYTVILRDISERKRSEEVARLYAQSKELDELKTQFFANISHELRTPLTLILGPVGRKLATAGLSEADRRELEMVERNARSLLRQVNDLLDLSKLDAGKMEAEYATTDLAWLGRVVGSNFETPARERGLSYVVDIPGSLPAQVDAAKLERVFLNLLSNAFKFTPAGGRVRFAMHGENGRAVVEVEDTGPGIPAHQREAIFERFRQIDSAATRQFGGTGLGLSIVKQFVSLHGGSTTVRAGSGGSGALFRVELPLMAAAGTNVAETEEEYDKDAAHHAVEELRMAKAARQEAARAPEDAPLVLVIEDNPDMNAFVSETLADTYRTAAAFDGQEGINQALELRPDLILCDIMMPGMSGDQVVRELRKRQELEDVPIVVLTAKADHKLLVELLEQGAQDYLQKPFAAEQLLAKMGRLIADRRRVAGELERLRELTGRLVQADDQDRKQIAHELHENIAQSLAALGMSLTQARDAHLATSPEAKQIISDGLALLETCWADIANMSYTLHPPVLTFFGLKAAIESYMKSFKLRTGVEVRVELPPELGRLPTEFEVALFRIMQEAVTDFRNAGETKITVCAFRSEQDVGLSVTGEGREGPPPEGQTSEHSIWVMRERARILGGRLEVFSVGDRATVRAVLPIAPRQSEAATRPC